MATRAETLAAMIETSTPLVLRFFAGFDETNRTTQAPGLPNHFAWTLGHCALTMHRITERLDGGSLPESDFAVGAVQDEDYPATRFGTEGVAFGSMPMPEPGAYPSVVRCIEIFEIACDRFVAAVRHAPEERFNATEKWGNGTSSMTDLIVRVNLHNAMHTGQLIDLRRALGLGRVIG